MNLINTDKITASKKVKKIVDDQQQRIWNLERALDDLARATEIAQYSQQYHVVETYRNEAEELLKDRLVLPDTDTSLDPAKMTIVTGAVTDETQNAINDHVTKKALVAGGVEV